MVTTRTVGASVTVNSLRGRLHHNASYFIADAARPSYSGVFRGQYARGDNPENTLGGANQRNIDGRIASPLRPKATTSASHRRDTQSLAPSRAGMRWRYHRHDSTPDT